MSDALLRLATATGIENGYWDALGTFRPLEASTARALLAGLGYDPDADPEAQCRELDEALYRRPLPAVVVLPEGIEHELWLALPVATAGARFGWELELEDGERLSGDFSPVSLARIDSRELDGELFARFALRLRRSLPRGYHRFGLPARGFVTDVIVAPPRCFIPGRLAGGGRCWGVAVQLYALRSPRNWGIGDFTDLATMGVAAGNAGAAFVGLNPLHARVLARPEEASPYAPSSRLHLDPVYLDVEAIAEFDRTPEARALLASSGFQERLAAARACPFVDYPAVTSLKLEALRLLHAKFRAGTAGEATPRAQAYRAFVAAGGTTLRRFAEFEALCLALVATRGRLPAWDDWLPEWRDPQSALLEQFRERAAAAIDFQLYLQWQATEQFDAAVAAARAAGLSLGFYRDLAVAAARDGAENWSDPALVAQGMKLGAPPDPFSAGGQNWGMPPGNPRTQVERGFRPFAALLAANMRGGGALRIDHVMSLARLFWIPDGMPNTAGGYVHNPFESLAAVVALESVRNRCLVIGEDLGSVPEGLRERLQALGFLSYRVVLFERNWATDGSFRAPGDYPVQALAIAVTHDLPTIAEFWTGGDIGRRAGLGLLGGEPASLAAKHERQADRRALLRFFAEARIDVPDPSDPAAVTAALHEAVAKTASMLAVVQLDDLNGESEPINIPGTHHQYANFRRKLSRPLEAILADPRWRDIAQRMRRAGRGDPEGGPATRQAG